MNRAYIAAPIFNAHQLGVVREITIALKLLDFEYFSPYEASQEIWRGRAPKDCTAEERNQVLKGNIGNLLTCDLLIAWVGGTDDGKTDTGVTWEMAYFKCLTNYCINTNGFFASSLDGGEVCTRFTLVYIHPDDKRQHMNLMLAGTVDAVVSGPAQLHRALSVLRWSRSGHASFDGLRKKFHPDKSLLQEKDPIV